MDLAGMIQRMKQHPLYPDMGMIASHLGVVRATSLSGERVNGIEIEFDQGEIDKIANKTKEMPGVIDVLIETATSGRLAVGDDIMAVVVGGDTREHVFPALIDAVDRIKKHGAKKREFIAI
jgi:molybdopterin synthase catalytic subunit